MNIKRLVDTPTGKIAISIILGLGLASLFRKVCTDKNCIVFNGPVIGDFENKTYQHGEKCYQYSAVPDSCNSMKRIVDVGNHMDQ
jgi:3-phosphoglycerate kinase